MNHLDIARKWKNTDSRLPFFYSRLLEERGEGLKAVMVLKDAEASNPQSKLELAKLYERLGNEDGKKRTATEAENYFVAWVLDIDNESDRLAVADARILLERLEEAAEILEECLRKKLGGERTIRQLSEVQRMIYKKSVRKDDNGKVNVDLSFLRKAADTDPENPNISAEVARLVRMGVQPSQDLQEVFKKQLDFGITNASALILMAEGLYAKGNLVGAKKCWELAIAKEPGNFVALNNLAFCLTAISPTNADKSLALLSKANSISPNNPTILATWGEVLMTANRPKEALSKFELAIKLDNSRLETRKKLLTAYQANGMQDMANTQATLIQEIEVAKSKENIE